MRLYAVMNDDQIIIRGWSNDEEFLALKLRKIFSELVTEEDKNLHNDMLRDIQTMVGGTGHELRMAVARILIGRPRNLLRSVANAIIQLSLRNITHGKQEKAN